MNIQSAIDRHGTTKAELARKLGSSPSYITQLVNCKSAPSMKQLDKLAELIGCKRWEFFIDEMDPAEVARVLGITPAAADVQPSAPAAPQPAAEPRKEATSQADSLPLTDGRAASRLAMPDASIGNGSRSIGAFDNEPSASVQGALICPHCHQPFTVEIKG